MFTIDANNALSNETNTTAPLQNNNGVANFYLVALCSVGLSLRGLLKMKKYNTPFFYLPMTSLLASIAFIFLDLNQLFYPDMDEHTKKIIGTTMCVLDLFGSISLQFAYYLRLRMVVKAARTTRSIPRWLDLASHLFLLCPISWPVADAIPIWCIWDEEAARMSGGRLSQQVTGAWNLLLAVNDLGMHIGFVFGVVHMLSLRGKKKKDAIYLATLLCVNSLGLVAAAVMIFFDAQIGTILGYSFWLNNVLVFLVVNSILRHAKSSSVSRTPNSSSGSGIPSEAPSPVKSK
jgi:hypothetical protein